MKESLDDVALPSGLSERAREIFDLDVSPATLEDLINGWWACGCPTDSDDLVRTEQTPHGVNVAGRMRFVWCALDAMILAILEQEKVELRTSDPETGHIIEMSLDPADQPVRRNNAQVPVLAFGFASTGFVDLKCSCCPCPYLNLFESAESYEQWRAKEEGSVTMPLTIEQAWRLAHRWASAMRPVRGVENCNG